MSRVYPEALVHISEIIYFREFNYPIIVMQHIKRNS